MDDYIRKKVGIITPSRGLLETPKRLEKNENQLELKAERVIKKVKLNEIFLTEVQDELDEIVVKLKKLKQKINIKKNAQNDVILAKSSSQEPQLKTSIPQRNSQKSNINIQQPPQLEIAKIMAAKRKSLYRRAPNQISDGQQSQSSSQNVRDGDFIPKP